VLLHLAGTAVGVLQLLLFLIFLGVPHDPIPVIEAFLVALVLDLFSFFIPARLGAYEGSRVIAMSVAGFAPALGLLFSLVLRVEQVVWAGIGLVLYPSMAARRATGAAAEADDERVLDGAPRGSSGRGEDATAPRTPGASHSARLAAAPARTTVR